MNEDLYAIEQSVKRCTIWIMLILFMQILTFLVLIISLGFGLPKFLSSIDRRIDKASNYLEENINALSVITAELSVDET